MKLLKTLQTLYSDLRADACKLHLATWNGQEKPIDVYLQGDFNEWQRFQTQKNFSRSLVVSLIQLSAPNQWLFAGIHRSQGAEWIEQRELYYYDLSEVPETNAFNGRIVVNFERPGRQSYLLAERWQDNLNVSEVKAARLQFEEFPGYRGVHLSYSKLQTLVRTATADWRAALSQVAGVYLIVHVPTGGFYVGSAQGAGGIWQRWSDYAASGHGGNVVLKKLLSQPSTSAQDFEFAILEVADVDSSQVEILARESHWKQVLKTRSLGMNRN
jgi:GIY-YIG catalytic domain